MEEEEEADSMTTLYSSDFNPITDQLDDTFRNFRPVDINYKFRRYIGRGSYSHVFLAHRRGTLNRVAIKRLRRKYVRSRPVSLWKREFDIGHQLCHRNIIKYLNIMSAFSGKSICFVMEYCQNNLYSFVSTSQLCKFKKKKALYEILKGVEYLQAKNILHHNLKPDNILVDNSGTIKISNFGQALRTKLSRIRNVRPFGTSNYVAIEVLLGSEKYTKAVDIWSVGCIFAFLWKRSHLFVGTSYNAVAADVFKICGSPSEYDWPGVNDLPGMQIYNLPKNYPNILRWSVPNYMGPRAKNLLSELLTYCPERRITASNALAHNYFSLGREVLERDYPET